MNIDARGDVCPIPVIKARKAIKEFGGRITVEVDNEIAAQNLEKMCKETGMECEVEKISAAHYIVAIGGSDASPQAAQSVIKPGDYLVVISSDVMGGGNDELGAALMKSFIFALAEHETPPHAVVFYNGGAKLTTGGAATVSDLRRLEGRGVEIHTCGACLNFYGLTEKLEVGGVTNMYAILDMMSKAARIVRP